jgi:Predicted nucleotide-binding protein containing TIR-like domain
VFIASSAEALPTARAVKENFDREADVDIWSEDIFKVNRGSLDTLLNRASYYDFVIAVFTADDEAVIRERKVKVTRDNVIFEFGLFLGRLGPNRTFMVVQEGVEMFTDWDGITTAEFRPRDNLVAAVGAACNRIREEMAVAEKLQNFTMLPSTSLAIGYYNNFLKKVFEAFEFTDKFQIVERDDKGNEIERTVLDITNRHPTIHVMLPQDLGELEADSLKDRTAGYKQIRVSNKFRSFPFYIEGDPDDIQNNPTLFDVPTTMLSSHIAIKKIFSEEFLARENTLAHLESREIANFKRTVLNMVPGKVQREHLKFHTWT